MICKALCNTCLQAYELLLQPSDVGLVKQITDELGLTAPCPRLCGGRINVAGDPVISAMQHNVQLADPIHLTGKELYIAVNGAGLPDEIAKDKEVIVSLLKANRVKDVDVEEADGKFYIHEITLENGTTIHLGASPRGARVVKMTKERPHGVPSGS